jgi:hypothetical protein
MTPACARFVKKDREEQERIRRRERNSCESEGGTEPCLDRKEKREIGGKFV